LLKILFRKKYRNEVSAKYTIEVINRHYNIEKEVERIYENSHNKNNRVAA
jgi:hypothetical protein